MQTQQAQKKKVHFWNYALWDFIKITGVLPGLLWFRPKYKYAGPEAKKKVWGGALVIANHTGFADPIHIMSAMWYRRHRFLCMKEIMDRKTLGWLFRLFLCIPIDRENMSTSVFRDITQYLQDGWMVSMFPEGHINDGSGNMGAFKSGMVLMALKGGKPIIPVYIRSRKHFWQRTVVVMGEPVDIVKMYGSRPTFTQIREMTQLLYEKEEQMKQIAEED